MIRGPILGLVQFLHSQPVHRVVTLQDGEVGPSPRGGNIPGLGFSRPFITSQFMSSSECHGLLEGKNLGKGKGQREKKTSMVAIVRATLPTMLPVS